MTWSSTTSREPPERPEGDSFDPEEPDDRAVTLPAMLPRTTSGFRAALTCVALVAGTLVLSTAPAGAQGTDPTEPTVQAAAGAWVVSVGDSYISGEGGRWAGNKSGFNSAIDALGSSAYYDNPGGTAEQIERCHRSKSAAIHIGDGVTSVNLACSGALSMTTMDGSNFKPGIDFADLGGGRVGQARMLQDVATANPVKMVVLSIGGNDFNFGAIVKQCVEDFLKPTFWGWIQINCYGDDDVKANMTAQNAAMIRDRIVGAIANIRTAMRNAGRADTDWTLVVQTYPQILPYASEMGYSDSGYTRQSTGGCGFTDPDVNWAVSIALGTINNTVRGAVQQARTTSPTRIEILDNSATFAQRGLCDRAVNRVDGGSGRGPAVANWQDPLAVDRSEWVTEINTLTVGSFYQQESLHPNYWGQLALRNCLRQMWNSGNVVGATCMRGTGLNVKGEPNMWLAGRVATTAPVATSDRYAVSGGSAYLDSSKGVLANDVHHDVRIEAHPTVASSMSGASMGAASMGAAAAEDAVAAANVVATLPAPDEGLHAEVVQAPLNGTLLLQGDGSFLYQANPGFVGTDSFTYSTHDFFGQGSVGTVTLDVAATVVEPPPTRAPARLAFTG
jgi:hypothetical protein